MIAPLYIKQAKASDEIQEKTLNFHWINEIVENLSLIVKQNKTYQLWQGRDFGTNGEREAAYRIKEWMELYSKNLSATVYLDRVGNDSYDGSKEDEEVQHRANDIIEIADYCLQLNNSTITITIPDNETSPMPRLIWKDTWTDINSSGFCDLESVDLITLRDLISDEFEISYTILGNTYTAYDNFNAGIALIDDYSTVAENETIGKMHFLEFFTNESEDTYEPKVSRVIDSNGSGFLISSTNPSYIRNLSIDSFGLAISPEDGVKIKNYVTSNATVILSFPENEDDSLQTSGTCNVYVFNRRYSERKIGLVEETSDYPPDSLFVYCLIPYHYSPYVGFIFCN